MSSDGPLLPPFAGGFDTGFRSINWLFGNLFRYVALVVGGTVMYTWNVITYMVGPERWKPFMEKQRWELQFTNRRIFLFLLSLAWTIVLWVGVLYKCIYESVTEFISFFTNISFSYQAAFFLLYTLSFFGNPRKRTLEFFVLFGFWWNVFAQIVIVFVLVFGVFLDAPGLIIGETKTGGGEYDDGVVLVVDRLYHVVPLVIGLVVLFCFWVDLSDIYTVIFARVYSLPKFYNGELLCSHRRAAFKVDMKQAWWYILFNYAMAFLPILLYYNIVDLRVVYDLSDFPTYAAILLMFGINFFAVLVPLLFMFYVTIPSRDVPRELLPEDSTRKVVVIPNGAPLPS